MFTHRSAGNFRFVPGSATFCNGVVADAGYGLVHVSLRRPAPLAHGFEIASRHLTGAGRPMAALCGVELRIPAPLSFQDFGSLNAGYIALLEQHGLSLDGKGTATRTNVAPLPAAAAPAEPSVYGFTYTVPEAQASGRAAFIGSGIGELRPGPAARESLVRPGETSPEAMREKAEFVMGEVGAQMGRLGVSWDDVTRLNVYTAHALEGYLQDVILAPMGAAAVHGAHWYLSYPPVIDLEFEIDVRGAAAEIVV
jgi:hypothetical protein